MRIGILTGTRPDIIKMAPLFWEAKKRGHTPVLIHTGQHYSDHLFSGVYKNMGLPLPHHRLEVGNCASPAESLGKMVLAMDRLLREKERPDVLLVHGDTLTSLSGALAAYLNLVMVGHVEAGLRTFSHEPFPEQLDTRGSDAASDLYFAATETNRQNLLNEGFPAKRIFVAGNTSVDTALWASKKPPAETERFFLAKGVDFSRPTIYFSIHRRETTLSKERFTAAAEAAFSLADDGYCVVWSIRPGTAAALGKYGLSGRLAQHRNIHAIEEIPSYVDIIHLMKKCRFVCTDSGSMQEECCALHIPCVTVRYVTDRPESVEAGANILAKPDSAQTILAAARQAEASHAKMSRAQNPYGGGNSAALILDALEKWDGKLTRWEHEMK
ncbi:MAG: UDP-N-acetylglucosamine 2-epimerase (non-hydrolyzing) [Candidatus Micrarchaeia archaeon]|jgi:UDP-N-acetylglucosamine 2-epimerase (non-hydrolysing)